MSGADEGTPPKPGEFICLDATPLLTFNKIGELETLQTWLPTAATPTYVMEKEVLAWKTKYPENEQFAGAAWPLTIPTDTVADAATIAHLGQFFAEGAKNVGELHVMALTHRLRGTAILDDSSARKRGQSLTPKLKSVFMVSMIAAASISGLLSEADAWELQCLVENSRAPGFAIIRAEDKKEFQDLLHFYRQIEKNKGWKEWPHCLHDRLLDAASIAARKQQLQSLYEKSQFGSKK